MNNLLHFLLVATVFISNFLILILEPYNFGFGRLDIALLGIILTITGLFFWLGGYISLGKSFSLLPRAKRLVKNGLYRFVKHPIYLGMTLTFGGLSLAKGTLLGLLFTLLVTTPLNFLRAKREEKLLREKFKDGYQ